MADPDPTRPVTDQPVAERLQGIIERLREKLLANSAFDQEAARDLEELAKLAAALVPPPHSHD